VLQVHTDQAFLHSLDSVPAGAPLSWMAAMSAGRWNASLMCLPSALRIMLVLWPVEPREGIGRAPGGGGSGGVNARVFDRHCLAQTCALPCQDGL
jgi:hypothetical protein